MSAPVLVLRPRLKGKAVHLIEETRLTGAATTWCGKRGIAGVELTGSGSETTCRRCIAAVKLASDLSSKRRAQRLLQLDSLAWRAAQIFSHRAESYCVPWGDRTPAEREGWIDVVLWLEDELEELWEEKKLEGAPNA